jgi:hypothetical protein
VAEIAGKIAEIGDTNFKASIPDHKFRAEFVDLLRITDRGDMAPRELHRD